MTPKLITNPIRHYVLEGDPLSSFKELGALDRDHYQGILLEIKNLLKIDTEALNLVIQKLIEMGAKKFSKHNLLFPEYFNAYLEGLGEKEENVLSAFMVPEIITAIKKFLPKIPLPSNFLACSSLFAYDSLINASIHGRILDFPVIQNYPKAERSVLYNFPGQQKIWSLGVAGLPYPSLTSMNESGVTCAVHMKYGQSFNQEGHFIFEIIYKVLQEATTPQSVISLLKELPPLSTWGLYFTFKDGEALSVDLFDNKVLYHLYDLKSENYVYENNAPIKESEDHLKVSAGLNNYCSMRRCSAENKIHQFLEEHDPSFSDTDLLKLLGRPHSTKYQKARNWTQDTITTSSVHVLTMNGTSKEVHYVPGPVPKILEDEILKFTDIFSSEGPKVYSLSSGLKPLDPLFVQGFRFFAEGASAYEQKDKHKAYHKIQMAIDALKDYPEEKIAEFYFYLFQFIDMDNENDQALLVKKLRDLVGDLPPYLKAHCLLTEARLERILHGSTNIQEFEIELDDLKQIFKFEQKIPVFILKKLKNFITPNIGCLDVLYTYPI